MTSKLFIDSEGEYDGRDRHDVLTDFQLNEWIKDDLGYNDFDSVEELEDGLSDDTIYMIEKDYYHTPQNVDREKAHKVGAGADNLGIAGDIDVGKIDLNTGKITRIELKSPGRIPPSEERSSLDQSYDLIQHGIEQNEYLGELLDNIERNTGFDIPYSSRVLSWNDVVDDPLSVDEVPNYSDAGSYLCTEEAEQKAENSDVVESIDNDLFKGWMLGGNEDILENYKRF